MGLKELNQQSCRNLGESKKRMWETRPPYLNPIVGFSDVFLYSLKLEKNHIAWRATLFLASSSQPLTLRPAQGHTGSRFCGKAFSRDLPGNAVAIRLEYNKFATVALNRGARTASRSKRAWPAPTEFGLALWQDDSRSVDCIGFDRGQSFVGLFHRKYSNFWLQSNVG